LDKFEYLWGQHEKNLADVLEVWARTFPPDSLVADLVQNDGSDGFNDIADLIASRLAPGQTVILTHTWEAAENYLLGIAARLYHKGIGRDRIVVICCGYPKKLYQQTIIEYARLYHLPYFLVRTYNNNSCLTPGAKKPGFICLNRRPKFPRSYLISCLLDLGLADHCSWAGKDIYFNVGPVSDYTKQKIDSVMNLDHARSQLDDGRFTRYLNNWQWFSSAHHISSDIYPNVNDHSTNSPVYNHLINVISETYCDDSNEDGVDADGFHSIFLTEKTYKSIYAKQIFLIQNSCHTLDYLRMMGFKTFEMLDQSYDRIPDVITRTEKLIDVLQDCLQNADLNIMTCTIRNHNHNHMISLVESGTYLLDLN
jgi:hypothetical protein